MQHNKNQMPDLKQKLRWSRLRPIYYKRNSTLVKMYMSGINKIIPLI